MAGGRAAAGGGGGDDLLARERVAATLDEPSVGGDLVGPVDGDVQAIEVVERLDREPERTRQLLRARRGGDTADVQPTGGQGLEEAVDRRAGAEPDDHPLPPEPRG